MSHARVHAYELDVTDKHSGRAPECPTLRMAKVGQLPPALQGEWYNPIIDEDPAREWGRRRCSELTIDV